MLEEHTNLFIVSDQDLEQRVLNSDLPVIVDFTAEWCPPCRVLAPLFARLSDAYQGKLRFAKMDTDENTRIPGQLGVQGIPTLVLFANGRPAGRVIGPYPGRLQQTLDALLAEASAGV